MARSLISMIFICFCFFLVSCEQYATLIKDGAISAPKKEMTLYEEVAINLNGSTYRICESVGMGYRLYTYQFSTVNEQIVMDGSYHGLYLDSDCAIEEMADYTSYSWQSTILSIDGELGALTAEFKDENDQITTGDFLLNNDYSTYTILVSNYCAPWARCSYSQYNIDLERQP